MKKGIRGEEWVYENSVQNYIKELEKALQQLNLKSGELFILYEYEGREDARNIGEVIPFYSFDKVYQYLHGEDIMEYDPKETWYELEKWTCNEDGDLKEICTWRLVGGEVFWYWDYELRMDFFELSPDLNLPIPFRCGDIIEIDARPFYEKKRAIIVDVGDNNDCCCVQVLHIRDDGELKGSALKHGFLFEGRYGVPSALYSAVRYLGELEGPEKVFEMIRDFIDNNREFWEAYSYQLLLHDTRLEDISPEYLESLKDIPEQLGWKKYRVPEIWNMNLKKYSCAGGIYKLWSHRKCLR